MCAGVATVCNWLFQMAVNMAFEPLLAATSTATTFGVSLVVMVFALGFIHAFLPETRGLEGEEIVTYDICSMQQVQIPPSLSSSSLSSLDDGDGAAEADAASAAATDLATKLVVPTYRKARRRPV